MYDVYGGGLILPQVGCRVGEFTVVSFSKIKSDHPIRDVLKTAP